jgi:hypothetical protein
MDRVEGQRDDDDQKEDQAGDDEEEFSGHGWGTVSQGHEDTRRLAEAGKPG